MGIHLIDQYSLLHFASGIIAYFAGVPFIAWVVMNFIFEAIENSGPGMSLINNITGLPVDINLIVIIS